jgi:hypothetical protein
MSRSHATRTLLLFASLGLLGAALGGVLTPSRVRAAQACMKKACNLDTGRCEGVDLDVNCYNDGWGGCTGFRCP